MEYDYGLIRVYHGSFVAIGFVTSLRGVNNSGGVSKLELARAMVVPV